MPKNNQQAILDTISDIYQTVYDPTHWQAVLQGLATRVNNGKAAITVRDNELGHIDLLDVLNTKTFGFSKKFIEQVYTDEINLMNNWVDIEYAHELGELCIYENHLALEELIQTEFYKLWLEPQNITGGVSIQIFRNQYFRIVLTIKYNELKNSKALMKLFEDLKILSPHLCQATSFWMSLSGISDTPSHYKGRSEYLMKRYSLSKRELEVAAALVRLSTIKNVAESLYISENTVKYHIKVVKKKMGLKTSHEMMLRLFSYIDYETVETSK